MSNSAETTLQKAYELIENNQLAEARDLIEPLLESDRDNPAVWWIYAHAVEDPDEGREALQQVLKLDPTHTGATGLQSRMASPVVESNRGVIKKLQKPEAVDELDDWDDIELDEDIDDIPEAKSGRSPLRLILVGVVAILLVILAFLLLSGALGGQNPPPTSIAGNPTSAPTLDVQIVVSTPESTEMVEPTEAFPSATAISESTEAVATDTASVPEATEAVEIIEATAETVGSNFDSLQKALSAYDVEADDIVSRSTSLGQTVQVKVCSPLGPQSSITLNDVLQIFVEQVDSLPSDSEAVAVSLVDCAQNGFPRTIGVAIETVRGVSDGTLSIKDLQRELQPIQ